MLDTLSGIKPINHFFSTGDSSEGKGFQIWKKNKFVDVFMNVCLDDITFSRYF